MPTKLVCYVGGLLRERRASTQILALGLSLLTVAGMVVVGSLFSGSPCAAQDLAGQLGATESAPSSQTVLTLLEQPDVINDLRLNQGQRDQIAKILEDQRNAQTQLEASHDQQLKAATSIRDRLRKRAELRAEMRTKMAEKLQEIEKTLRELLNEQQMSKLEEQLTKPATVASSAPSMPTNQGRSASVSTSRSRPEPVERSPDAKASFAIAGQASGESNPAANDATSGDVAKGDGSAGSVAFNFHKAPWADVLRLFADSAELNLNLRDTPPGTFTYYDQQQYTPLEALDIMNRFLLQDGFLLVPHDRFLTVLDAKKGIPPNLVKTVSPTELQVHGDTEYLRVAFALGDREAGSAAEEVRGLLGPQGEVVPLDSANSIVVSDITSNLVRVKQLLEPPPKVEDTDRMFRSFPLVHIDAPAVAEIVSSLFGIQSGMQNVSEAGRSSGRSSRSSGGSSDDFRAAMRERFFGGRGGSGGPGGRGGGDSVGSRDNSSRGNSAATAEQTAVKVAVDLRTNSLLITSTALEMKLIEDIVKSVDVPPSQERSFGGIGNNDPYLQVYELNTASASEVAKTLTVLHPGMVINEDGSAKRIHIWADPASHREIATHIRQLDGAIAGEVITIIGLNGQNAYDVKTKLTTLYANDAAGAPAIELDPSGQGLMIRGNASQIAQIRSLVDQLGVADPYDSQQTVRLVPVSSSNSEYLQQTIGALYPQITVIESEQAEGSSSSGSTSSRGGDRGRSSSEDAERADRIRRFMEMRARFMGGGGDRGRGGGDGDRGRGGGDRGRGGGDRSSPRGR